VGVGRGGGGACNQHRCSGLNLSQIFTEGDILKILLCFAVLAFVLLPAEDAQAETCEASYYSWELAGNLTASGEPFNPLDYTAAHWTYEFGSVLYVENLWTGQATYVRVSDRGPASWTERCLDLSLAAAEDIGMTYSGFAPVHIEPVYLP